MLLQIFFKGARLPAVHSTKGFASVQQTTSAERGAGVPAWASPHLPN